MLRSRLGVLWMAAVLSGAVAVELDAFGSAHEAVRPAAQGLGLSAAERQQVHAAIAAASYYPSAEATLGGAPVLVARNRRQRYQTAFRADAIEIASRSDWRLGVSLRGFGRGGDIRPLPAGEPRAERERVEYRRGPVTEWYVNGPDGLEQGFDVADAPGDPAAPLVLALAVDGSLDLCVEQHSARFSDYAGRTVVRYDGLEAWDAAGRSLPARMEASARELHLVVQAQGASFPVTVDPTFRHEAQLVAADGQPNDLFGGAMAISIATNSTTTLVVGAAGDDTSAGANSGTAYVFVRSGTDWILQQKLTAPDAAAGDDFGSAVAVFGDSILIGAPGDDFDGKTNVGSAYLFSRSGSTWVQQARFASMSPASGRRFGHAVALQGPSWLTPETAVIGSFAEEAVYVFVRPGPTWAFQGRLTASNGLAADRFGRAVAIFGSTIVVGAPGRDVSPGDNSGGAYVWARNGSTWSPQAQLGPLVPVREGAFGASVALDLDTAVVGSASPKSSPSLGYADVFLHVFGTGMWIPQQRLQSSDGALGDHFGASVAIREHTIVVGAPSDGTVAGARAGSAYVFVRLAFGSTWTQRQRLAAKDAQAADNFGRSVALYADTALVGAPAGLATDAGAAYSYRLFTKGDINRDGETDLLVRLNTTGRNEAWLMNQLVLPPLELTRPSAPVELTPAAPSLDWIIAGSDDFNRDGGTDLLFWNGATGAADFWLMDRANRVGAPVPLAGALPPPWRPSATADFNADGHPDIVYRNLLTQNVSVWTMNGTTHTGTLVPVPGQAADASWDLVGAQDWNADGATDLLWYNATSGRLVLWYLDANLVRITGVFTNPDSAGDANWKVLASGDYGAGPGGLPGTVDLVWRNGTSGRFVVWYMDQAGNRTFGEFTTPDAPSPNPTDWTIVGPR